MGRGIDPDLPGLRAEDASAGGDAGSRGPDGFPAGEQRRDRPRSLDDEHIEDTVVRTNAAHADPRHPTEVRDQHLGRIRGAPNAVDRDPVWNLMDLRRLEERAREVRQLAPPTLGL